MCGRPGQNTRPHARLPSSFPGMDAWMTSQLNVVLIHKLRGSLICMAKYFEMLFIEFYTTRHRRASGLHVHDLNVCTVHSTTGAGGCPPSITPRRALRPKAPGYDLCGLGSLSRTRVQHGIRCLLFRGL